MRWEGDKGGRAGSEGKLARVELRARILAEWATGKYDSEIARELGLTDGVVHGIIFNSSGPDAEKAKAEHYRNKALRERIKRQSPENFDRETRVLARWAAGASAGDIAKELRVSANVVIGIIHRATGEDAEAAKRAHSAIVAQRHSGWSPRSRNPQPKAELRLIDNPQFVARIEQPSDLYAHMRTERGYQDAIAALSR